MPPVTSCKRLVPMLIRTTCLAFLIAFVVLVPARLYAQPISIEADFSDRSSIGRYETISFSLSRAPTPEEGRLSVWVGASDVTAFLEREGNQLRYDPVWAPLPSGDQEVMLYLISPANDWQELMRLPVRIQTIAGFEKIEIAPNITLNNKGQLVQEQFPEPDFDDPRKTYQDISGQFNLNGSFVRPRWALQTQMNVVGVSFQNEALRFF